MTSVLECCASILLYLYDIQTHVNNMFSTGAVVSGPGVAFQSITEVTTVQVVVSQIIMASPRAEKQRDVWYCIMMEQCISYINNVKHAPLCSVSLFMSVHQNSLEQLSHAT